jgi:hypothetical protein
MRGRPPIRYPSWIDRVERTRHEIRVWAIGWPQEFGPTFIFGRQHREKPVGRPHRSLDEQRELLRLRMSLAAYEWTGCSKKEALGSAMDCLGWSREDKDKQFERVRTLFSRRL